MTSWRLIWRVQMNTSMVWSQSTTYELKMWLNPARTLLH
jgi:hypothetical protein